MRLEGIGARRTVMLVGAVGVVALLAAACLPPQPAPSTTTTTTTLPPPPSICGISASSVAPAPGAGGGDRHPSSSRYAAVVRRDGRSRVLRRTVNSPAELAQFEAEAAAEGEVLALAPDEEVYATAETPTWGFLDSKFSAAWGEPTATTGGGVRVAELDTGIDTTHPDLTGHFDATPGADIVAAADVNNPPPATTDPSSSGHGTHVAGIVAATENNDIGVEGGAPGVTLVPVRVLDADGAGSYSDVAAGILWAADVSEGNAQVITMSLGGGDDNNIVGQALATVEDPTNPLYTHPVVTIAAGNAPACQAPAYPAIYGGTNPYQAPLTSVLAVSALCKPGVTGYCPSANPWPADGYRLATYSKLAWNGVGSPAGISAPGTQITSTLPGGTYGSLSGTSMATPFVAAAAALVIAHCPMSDTYTGSDVVHRLEVSAHDLGPSGPDQLYGYGMLDADNAVQAC